MQTEKNQFCLVDATSILDAMKNGKTPNKNILYTFSNNTNEDSVYHIFFDKDTYPIVKKYFKKKKAWSVHDVKCAKTSIRAYASSIYTQQENSKIALVTGRAQAFEWVFSKVLNNDKDRIQLLSVVPPNE